MTVGRAVTLTAGTLVLVSLLFAWIGSDWWLLLAAFVGVNLIQSSFTGFCPAASIFKMFGLPPGGAFV
jgi:hypothetical protein